MDIDISKLDKAEVLVALYNNARAQGLGAFQHTPDPMSRAEAEQLLFASSYFDYVHGRVMKVSLADDTLRTGLYDRDNGEGAAERALRNAGLLP